MYHRMYTLYTKKPIRRQQGSQMGSLNLQLKAIFDGLTDSIVIFDSNGNITYKNNSFRSLMKTLESFCIEIMEI